MRRSLSILSSNINSEQNLATIVKSGLLKTKVYHRPQPSLFYYPGLASSSIWPYDKLPQNIRDSIHELENNYETILKDYQHLKELKFQSDYKTKTLEEIQRETSPSNNGHLALHSGKWDWFSYISQGKEQENFKENAKNTVDILNKLFPQTAQQNEGRLMLNTPFSFTFFSILHPNSFIKSHTSPCNLRLRCHFPLEIPKEIVYLEKKKLIENEKEKYENFLGSKLTSSPLSIKEIEETAGMRIAEHTLTWKEGKPFFFDDSYIHEGKLLFYYIL